MIDIDKSPYLTISKRHPATLHKRDSFGRMYLGNGFVGGTLFEETSLGSGN